MYKVYVYEKLKDLKKTAMHLNYRDFPGGEECL
jgi:hypothetical protein